jgi:hypothetical protein
MITSGVKVISSGANVPFADPEIFFGKIAEKADASLALIPDFIANCGMARVFAYLMSNDLKSIDIVFLFLEVVRFTKGKAVSLTYFDDEKGQEINTATLPQHLAIIMDGNGRWAKQQGKLRTFGHQSGVTAVIENYLTTSPNISNITIFVKYLTSDLQTNSLKSFIDGEILLVDEDISVIDQNT